MATLKLLFGFPRLARYHTVLIEQLGFKTLPLQDILLGKFFSTTFFGRSLTIFSGLVQPPERRKNMKMSRESNPGAQSLQTNVQ